MAKPRNPYLDYLVYLAVRLTAMFLHMFPLRLNYRIARVAGNLGYRWVGSYRRRALGHIRRSFPDWPDEKCRRFAQASMRSLAKVAMEAMFTTRLITPARWRRHVRLVDQADNLRLLTERKTGLIYVTGHFGNWEIVGYTLAALGFEGYAVARPLDNPYLNEFILGVREQKGLSILDKKGAAKLMDHILESCGYVSFMADQDAGRKGVFVDFFGRPASTFKSIALMAMRHEVPIIVGYGRRLDNDYHFEIGVRRIIHPREWAEKDDPMRWITQEYTTALEQIIRVCPEQYLWVHRRWKHRPDGTKPKDGIA
ncbi:MAG: lipid A biosynthesis acyltransferase [Planctomycetota bacterium]|nr:lipid A biosynthesis acyltransferase [Planctomycetota bacterium]